MSFRHRLYTGKPVSTFLDRRTRCSSTTYLDGKQLHCNHLTDHPGSHEGYVQGRLVQWKESTLPPLAKSNRAFPGWRAWRLALGDKPNDTPVLRSLSVSVNWETPRMVTKEGRRVQTRGGLSGYSDYGIYSYKTPSLMMLHLFANQFPNYPVIGRIDNLGHVVEHELGWRSQIAVVRELWLVGACEGWARKGWAEPLSRRYDCPVHILVEASSNENDLGADPWKDATMALEYYTRGTARVRAWAEWFTQQQEEAARNEHR